MEGKGYDGIGCSQMPSALRGGQREMSPSLEPVL